MAGGKAGNVFGFWTVNQGSYVGVCLKTVVFLLRLFGRNEQLLDFIIFKYLTSSVCSTFLLAREVKYCVVTKNVFRTLFKEKIYFEEQFVKRKSNSQIRWGHLNEILLTSIKSNHLYILRNFLMAPFSEGD